MAPADPSRLLRWYPPAWRDRYGEDFMAYMHDSFGPGRPPLAARLSVVAGGLRERARRSGLTGDSVAPPDRIRAAILAVLASWTAMAVAGCALAKMAEHYDAALPRGARGVPDGSFTAVQVAAGIGALAVLVGAAAAVPALVRYLRGGGWAAIRGHGWRAGGCSLLAAGATAGLAVWAHHLDAHQRSGGSVAYSAAFVAWGVLVAVALVSWTVLAVAAARRVTFSRPVLAAEAGLAVTVTFAMVVVQVASVAWWAAMARRAPAFLTGDPHSAVDLRLVAVMALMGLGAVGATAGSIRIGRDLPAWRRG